MPDTSVALADTYRDVGQLPEFKMAVTTFAFDDRHLEFRFSGNIGQLKTTNKIEKSA